MQAPFKKIDTQTAINAPVEKVWAFFNQPEHVVKWNAASPDWHTPIAECELEVGKRFKYRMEAKDGSFGFDFSGVYDTIQTNQQIAYTLDDGRKVSIRFSVQNGITHVDQTFEAEQTNPEEMQRMGWQAILDNFKAYTEQNA